LQAERMFELAEAFRKRGTRVAIGGSFASLSPEACEPHADILFVGESERIWPQFCDDFRHGRWKTRYEERERIDLTTSPIPRWDLVPIQHAGLIPVQTTRGCPFTCEFCDVIMYLGRDVHHKAADQVVAEIEALYPRMRALGRDSIFFADDNFIGNRPHAVALCKALIEFNRSVETPINFATQSSVNLARDAELLDLMAEARFREIFFGLESPKRENLIAADKRHNTIRDMADEMRIVQSKGIFTWAGMIVGFDADDASCFQEHFDFVSRANVTICTTGMLSAPAKTPLFERLQKEGRVLAGAGFRDQAATNIIPKQMTREQLQRGYVDLMNDLYSFENYGNRLIGQLAAIERVPKDEKRASFNSPRQAAHDVWRLLKVIRYLLLTFDAERRRYFFRVSRQILRTHPAYMKEALWHMALIKHFHTYSRGLQDRLD
jgi:radical SAM superfamily enzyme YgiQ (UPF0313 family)